MNIFLLDTKPDLIAQYHCDKHVVKMPIEYAQLLSSAMWSKGIEGPYKETHKNHPCAIWARQHEGNYRFLYDIALAVGAEYTYRYGKVHKSTQLLYDEVIPPTIENVDTLVRTPLPNCTTIKGEYPELNLVDIYRLYYLRDKAHILTWKNREEPWWMGERFYRQQIEAIGTCPGDPKNRKEKRATKEDMAGSIPALKGLLIKDLQKIPEFKKFTGDIPSGRLKKPYIQALVQVHSGVDWSRLTVKAMMEVLDAFSRKDS